MKINVNYTIKKMNNSYKIGKKFFPKLIYYFNRLIYACDIMPNKNIHESVQFPHNALGVVINGEASIEENSKILHGVTLGGNLDKSRMLNGRLIKAPVVGKNVLIGAGAILIGPIVVGDNAIIGAGSVVTKDVKENSIVAGNPAKEINKL